MIYIPIDNVNYAIAMLDDDVKEIPLSFKAATMGEYTISVNSDNKDLDYIYLVDNQTGNVTDMLVDEYTFVATTNDNPDRFVIKLYDVNSIDEVDNNNSNIYVNNGELLVDNIKGLAVIDIYDIVGRNMLSFETSQNQVRYSISDIVSGVYIIRIIDDNGIKANKIIVK